MASSMLDIDADLALRTPLVSASFRLTSERHVLDHLVREFNIEGGQCWQKGDADEDDGMARRAYGWSVALPPQRTYSVDTAINALLLRLAPERDAIIQLIRLMELDAHVCLEVKVAPGNLPVLHAAPATIAAMAAYHAACSVDLREL
ncbi:DUF4279 domain-containing protein [Luteibacter aegosomaticola]|jgi:hypothetical protein|uniref:DUF4279 domain-containing protein n=1 Tax=Luteibacter aegosomaticola TaxID=2911538 RepID=UPI001FFB1D6C|nr:DUF4279 domain-containing protein [Luteibacter aegosomaticola]UPG91390.1 DUF4279 domain-containing protein [Luteibacter aegosomaticola]